MSTAKKVWRGVRWPLLALLIVWAGFVLAEVHWPVNKERSDAAVAAIQAQRLTMADVDGSNLPPEPDPKKVNATIAGIDANENGIRDDVELAIFKKYPNNKKVRAAALQYAHALQSRLTQVIDENTWQASVYMKSRAYSCVSKATDLSAGAKRLAAIQEVTDFIQNLVLNTASRKDRDVKLEKFATSAETAAGNNCDVYE